MALFCRRQEEADKRMLAERRAEAQPDSFAAPLTSQSSRSSRPILSTSLFKKSFEPDKKKKTDKKKRKKKKDINDKSSPKKQKTEESGQSAGTRPAPSKNLPLRQKRPRSLWHYCPTTTPTSLISSGCPPVFFPQWKCDGLVVFPVCSLAFMYCICRPYSKPHSPFRPSRSRLFNNLCTESLFLQFSRVESCRCRPQPSSIYATPSSLDSKRLVRSTI